MPKPPGLTVHRKSSLEGSTPGGSAVLLEEGEAELLGAPRMVLLVRHGEGTHNAATNRWGGENPTNTIDPLLTEKGLSQASALAQDPKLAAPNLIVVSPMSRAIQTAVAAFGQSPGCRIVLTPLHSERWSAPCDQGRPKSELVAQFPFVREWEEFDALPEIWTPTEASDVDWKKTRVPAFLAWLKMQPEAKIVVVGHGAFFAHLLGKHLRNCEIGEIES